MTSCNSHPHKKHSKSDFLVCVPNTVENDVTYFTCAESYHQKQTNTVLGIYSRLVNQYKIHTSSFYFYS